jgi:hypothetical protein
MSEAEDRELDAQIAIRLFSWEWYQRHPEVKRRR